MSTSAPETWQAVHDELHKSLAAELDRLRAELATERDRVNRAAWLAITSVSGIAATVLATLLVAALRVKGG